MPGPLSQDSHHSFDVGREICLPQHPHSTTASQIRSTHLMKSKAEKLSQQPSWFPRGTKKKEVEGELRTAAVAQERGSEIGRRIAALGKGTMVDGTGVVLERRAACERWAGVAQGETSGNSTGLGFCRIWGKGW